MVVDDVAEDRRRAEVFDALSHPTRILILKALSEGPYGFADLKKKLGIESSGHLQHHLSKLGSLVKTDDYGKYVLSDQGKDALLSVETVEKVAESGTKEKRKTFGNGKRKFVWQTVVIALALVLVASSAIAIFEYNQTLSLQNQIRTQNSIIDELNYSLTLAQGTLNIRPLEPQYLTTLPTPNGESNNTKLFLVSAEARYLWFPAVSNNVTVAIVTFSGSNTTGGLPYYVTGTISSGPYMGKYPLLIQATVRNDYAPTDAGNPNNLNAPIGNSTSRYASFITLTVRLYSQNGSVVQVTNVNGNLSDTTEDQSLVLGSGETSSFDLILQPTIPYIDHYEIFVSYLSSVPQ